MRFADHLALARLPYFDVVGGRLVVDPALGPVIDTHTHLALAYGPPSSLDLGRGGPAARHYLPLARPLDLERYALQNMTRADVRRMKLDLTLASITPWGLRRTHTTVNLLREMKELGVARAVLLPIELPLLSRNTAAYLRAAAPHQQLICFGSVHPLARGALRELDRQREAGARGIKLHPPVQLVRPDHPRAMKLYRRCAAHRLPVFWHCGPVGEEPRASRRRAQVALYERPIAEVPGATFVLGHSGALQMERALALANRYSNAWLDLSSQALANVRRIVERGPRDRLVFGSDWPFYHQAVALAKVLLATEGDTGLRRQELWYNAARLLTRR